MDQIPDQLVGQLIELYRNEQCLWNTMDINYLNAQFRDAALERIASQLGHVSKNAVVKKIRILRVEMGRRLRMIRQGASEKPLRPWRYMDSLDFLRDVIVPRVPTVKTLDSNHSSSGLLNSEIFVISPEVNNVIEKIESDIDSDAEFSDDVEAQDNSPSNLSAISEKRHKLSLSPAEHLLTSDMYDSISTTSKSADATAERGAARSSTRAENDHDAFSAFLYSLMKDMKPGPLLDMCRIEIQQTVMKYKYCDNSRQQGLLRNFSCATSPTTGSRISTSSPCASNTSKV